MARKARLHMMLYTWYELLQKKKENLKSFRRILILELNFSMSQSTPRYQSSIHTRDHAADIITIVGNFNLE